jgi:hypothetical protein
MSHVSAEPAHLTLDVSKVFKGEAGGSRRYVYFPAARFRLGTETTVSSQLVFRQCPRLAIAQYCS